MRRLLAALALCLVAGAARAQDIAPPQGYVNDRAGVIDAATRARMTALLQELQQKTGAEIAVLTVDTTAPLDDFSYALRVAEAWKIGRKGEDSGLLVLVAVGDRKIRVLTGYGLEGTLPDGLVGAIQDREILPEFRAGRMGEGIWRGVAAYAQRIAQARGVELTGVPAPRAAPPRQEIPLWVILLVLLLVFVVMSQTGGRGGGLRRGRRGGGPVIMPGGFGGGGGFGGFGGGGGGFGGFGGGGFGGGGAGRSW